MGTASLRPDWGKWTTPARLSDTKTAKELLGRLHAAALARQPDVKPFEVWERSNHSMWKLAFTIAAQLPELSIGPLLDGKGYMVAIGPADYAFRLDTDANVELRVLSTADKVKGNPGPATSARLFQSLRSIVTAISSYSHESVLVSACAARLVGNFVVKRATAGADTAETAMERAQYLCDVLGHDLNDRVAIQLVAIGDRACLRCIPNLCCKEYDRTVACRSCPMPLDAMRRKLWSEAMETDGLPIAPTTLAIRDGAVFLPQSRWASETGGPTPTLGLTR